MKLQASVQNMAKAGVEMQREQRLWIQPYASLFDSYV